MRATKILLLAATVFCGGFTSFAQTWTQTSAPTNSGRFWVSVACSADGSEIVAANNFTVGSGGGTPTGLIYTSTNSGATWTKASAPSNSWTSVASSADGSKFMAVGATNVSFFVQIGVFYLSTNSGATWAPLTTAPGQIFNFIAMSADGTKLAATSGGTICISTNAGLTWSSTNIPSTFWESVAISSDGSKMAAVSMYGGGGSIYTSTNFGLTFTKATNAPGELYASIASSSDGNKLVAVIHQTGGGGIYTSMDSGVTWTHQASASSTLPYQSVASSADGSRLVAVGAGFAFANVIVTSSDSGVTWVTNNAPTNNWNYVASSADGCKLFAVLYITSGGIWTLQTTPSPQLNLAPTPTNLTLAWTIPSTNFVLEQSADLAAWSPVTNPPVLNLTNLQNQVTLTPSNPATFYRLKTP